MLCSGSMELFGRVRRLRTPSGDRGHQTGDRLDEGAGEFVEDARRRPERQQVHYELYGVGRRLVDYVQRRQDHHDPRRRERRRRSCAGYRQVRGCLLLDAGRRRRMAAGRCRQQDSGGGAGRQNPFGRRGGLLDDRRRAGQRCRRPTGQGGRRRRRFVLRGCTADRRRGDFHPCGRRRSGCPKPKR